MGRKATIGVIRATWLVAAALLFLSAGAVAATTVSGSITANTVWSADQGPYQVTSDVSVENGATLTIKPGVVVSFGAGTSLIVSSGALDARGTSSAPIMFTSGKAAGAESPGDWGELRFLAGTYDATTVLEWAQIRYGTGVRIESASPTMNHVSVADCVGAAITMDLSSSPVGEGLQATGNAINGVAVPAGDILTSVAWKLKGIPYVVGQGRVSVGQSPAISSVGLSEIQQGETLDITLTGTRLAGVESIVLSNSAVSATLLSGATATSIPVRLKASTSAALGPVTMDVQLAAGRVQKANAFNVIVPKPPISVTGIAPDSLRRGESKTFQVEGSNLNGAAVTTTAVGLTISNVQSTATQLSFTLTASSVATLGTQTLTITNTPVASGSAVAQVSVINALPTVYTAPAPVATPPDATSRQIAVRLSNADIYDHSFAVSVADPTVATVTPAAFTIVAGQVEAKLTISGLKLGQTSITLTSATLGTAVVPVYVTNEYAGINRSFAPSLGVVLESPSTAPPQTTISPMGAPVVGVVHGAHVQGIAPSTLTVGTGPTPLTIAGRGLGAVTSVSIIPADGLALGEYSINAEGTALTMAVTVAADAPPTMRQIVLKAGSSAIPAVRPEADRMLVTRPAPELASIDPIVMVPSASAQVLTLRGRYLHGAQKVAISPADDIAVDAMPSVNADGTQVTVRIAVAATAAVGPRVVTVTTPGGTSSVVATAANTLNVVNELKDTFTPVMAASLGVVVEAEPVPVTQATGLNSAPLGIARGSVVTGINPSAGVIGTNVTLTVSGYELDSVSLVRLNPATGVTVGTPTVAPDGKSLTVALTIAADAPQTLRAVELVSGSTVVPAAPVSVTQFRVTPPQPEISWLSPLYLQVGQPLATYTLAGKNFQNFQQLRILPPDGITLNTPTANADGTQITVGMSAAASAALGPRVVVVDTAGGSSTEVSSSANTITLTDNAGNAYGPTVAPTLGVVLESPPAPVSTTYEPLMASQLGVVLESSTPPATQSILTVASPLGIAFGAVATGVEPSGAVVGTTGTLVVRGQGLSAVTSVNLSPATGVSFGAPTVNADGTEFSVAFTADVAAVSGWREVVLNTASSRLPFTDSARAQFYLGAGVPAFSSISPILANQGTSFQLTILGSYLQGAVAVTATPSEGVTFGSAITVNAAGTQLTVDMHLAADAPIGARVIRVVTPAAASTDVASPANTFTVYSP